MHVLDEILAEGYEEQYAQNTAEERAKEHFEEVDSDVGVRLLEYVEGRKGEDGTGHDYARAGTDRLYDDILPQRIFLFQPGREADGDDSDGYCRLKNLAYFQAQVGCRRAEYHGEYEAHGHRVGSDFGVVAGRVHDGAVLLVGT